LTANKKVWKNLVFCSIYNASTLFKNLQKVFNLQGVWHSPNMLPTMVHGQAFRGLNQVKG